jgi:alpha-L-fucosidase
MTEEIKDREKRMKWWRDARFGMFVHWGLYSQLGRHEWAMNRERIPVKDYEKLANTWDVKRRPAREWARLAKKAGMKYMVMTTKHHEGFCLWDTKMTDYNAVQHSPGRDLVKEYVEACREFGLKIGFYYSLMDWHHPDGARCAKNEKARRRFIDFTHGCVHELMTNYGKIDILWYDVAWPLNSAKAWESRKMNRMVRKLQPHIIINDRSHLLEDFGTPEENIYVMAEGRAWESCMTFNGAWGYMPYAPPEDWHTVRAVLMMLRQATAGNGNLLLNIGPAPDGSVPEEAVKRLVPTGKWLALNKEAVYGNLDRSEHCEKFLDWSGIGQWTRKGKTAYFWCSRWPGSEIAIGGLRSRLKKASILATGKKVKFSQNGERIVLKGLPKANPDKIARITVFKLEFASTPIQKLGCGCVVL